MSIWKYDSYLDSVPEACRLTLGEGATPLLRSRRLGPRLGLKNLFLKLESCNPTGSYKDRFAVTAVSHMLAAEQSHCLATSSGNTGSSLAGYCAAAGLHCRIVVLETSPLGKLQQMLSYGAEVIRVRGFGVNAKVTEQVFARLQDLGRHPGAAMQVSAFRYSPLGMSGVRSVAVEIAEEAAAAEFVVDRIFTQAGGGGLTLAVAETQHELLRRGMIERVARVECVQPAGNNTIAGPLREGKEKGQNVECTTSISGLQVASVVDADRTIEACRSVGGTGYLVSDEQIFRVQRALAREEGIFCEPAGATALAGVVQALEEGRLSPDSHIVALVTGSGFKDPPSVERMIASAECPLINQEELEERLLSE